MEKNIETKQIAAHVVESIVLCMAIFLMAVDGGLIYFQINQPNLVRVLFVGGGVWFIDFLGMEVLNYYEKFNKANLLLEFWCIILAPMSWVFILLWITLPK